MKYYNFSSKNIKAKEIINEILKLKIQGNTPDNKIKIQQLQQKLDSL